MKAILEFNLPEDQESFNVASRALDWAFALRDLDQGLRNFLKYGHEFKSADDAIEKIRKYIYEYMQRRGISFNDFV